MRVPEVLADRYEVGALVGRGGMAEVYLGRDLRLGRTVAVKVLAADTTRDPTLRSRFRREAQMVAVLNHPSIVTVLDSGEMPGPDGPVSFIVMEHVEGQTLRAVLHDGPLPVPQALRVVGQVLDALEHAHAAGIVHRDVKPANVMITPAGAVKVMDFGIARALDATTGLTQNVLGTAQYMSPEQVRGDQVDARADLHSVGCLLFETLAGQPPFDGGVLTAVVYQQITETPPPLCAVDPTLPPALG